MSDCGTLLLIASDIYNAKAVDLMLGGVAGVTPTEVVIIGAGTVESVQHVQQGLGAS